jgi:hypothetical protein
MDLTGIIEGLRQQRDQIDEALRALEEVAPGTTSKGAPTSAHSTNSTGKKKRIMSAAARRSIAEAQRKRWAKWKRAQKTT